jgi:uncharacterized membrane protein
VNWLIVVLRLLHIFAGVFWAGAVFMLTRFVMPAVAASGPEGGRFVRRVAIEQGLSKALVAAGLTTVLAGLALLWHDSAGFNGAWMGSGMGVMLSIGGLAGVGAVAAGIRTGLTIGKLSALGAAIEGKGGPPAPEQAAEMQRLQARLAGSTRATAIQLVIAVICMAVARYVVF